MAKLGRPLGKKSGYTMSAEALAARYRGMTNPKMSGHSKFMERLLEVKGITPEETAVLKDERMKIVKEFSVPTLLLANQYLDLMTLIKFKQMRGDDVLSSDILKATELLLHISKEINKLTTVSADKKYEAFTRSFNSNQDDDYVFEVKKVESVSDAVVSEVSSSSDTNASV